MFFEKKDIEENSSYGAVVNANVFLKRIEEAIKDKLVFETEYPTEKKVKLDEAEAFMFEIYGVLKKI